ncbi:MAG: peptidylprolyl isomerase [Pseudomonadota bacterium]|nr:peptidylprolyl isomerase [Pseudomonadota bacterium]
MHPLSVHPIFKEPILHFLFIGAVLFGLYGWLNPGANSSTGEIRVDQGRIDQLVAQFEKSWQRPPSADELQLLIDDFIVEEIFYRQALSLGLDSNDRVIRRRLRQKMEFLTTEAARFYEATDAELSAYLQRHPDKFESGSQFSFEQVFFKGQEPQLATRIQAAEQALRANLPVTGDATLLPGVVPLSPAYDIDSRFGDGFSAQLESLAIGQWSAPIQSEYGVHLVKLLARQAPRLPSLAEIRPTVEREWRNHKNQEVKSAMIERLKSGYSIVVETQTEGRI